MRVAVVDVGSNTVRLLVERGRATASRGRRAASARSGSAPTSSASARSPRRSSPRRPSASPASRGAQRRGASCIDVVVASPGRQAGTPASSSTCSRARRAGRGCSRREEEARLAFDGALAGHAERRGRRLRRRRRLDPGRDRDASGGPAWVRSIDLGSLRLSSRRPSATRRARTRWPPRREARAAFRADPAAAERGGRRRRDRPGAPQAGRPDLGRTSCGRRSACCGRTPTAELAGRYGIDLWRARRSRGRGDPRRAPGASSACRSRSGAAGLREGLVLELLDRLSLPAVQAGERVGLGPDHAGRDLEDPDRALLAGRVPADDLGDHVTVGGERGHRAAEIGEQRHELLRAAALRQLVALLEPQAQAFRRRLERLDAAQRWAGDEPGRAQVLEALREALRLLAAPWRRAADERRRRPVPSGRPRVRA